MSVTMTSDNLSTDRCPKCGQEMADCTDYKADNERLRAAAERVCWFDWSSNDPDAVAAIDALRAAYQQEPDTK